MIKKLKNNIKGSKKAEEGSAEEEQEECLSEAEEDSVHQEVSSAEEGVW